MKWRRLMEDIRNCCIRRIEDNTAWDRIESEVLIILTKDNDEKVFRLNKTAGYLWENCDGTRTVHELITRLCAEFDVDEAKALDDVTKFVEQMKGLKLVALS